MKLLLLLLVLVAAKSCTKDFVVSCLLDFADTNKDAKLSSGEIDGLLRSNSCMSASLRSDGDLGEEIAQFNRKRSVVHGDLIIMLCDLNRDGYLSASDYDERRGCASHPSFRTQLCDRCNRCRK